jgi:hypothetical protein
MYRFSFFSLFRELSNKHDKRLYKHSTVCSAALQRFLDKSPHYWCFVPMTRRDAMIEDTTASSITIGASTTAAPLPPPSPTMPAKPMFFAAVMEGMTRTKAEAVALSNAVPKPPTGYRFSHRQYREQVEFFMSKKDFTVYPTHLADMYNYSIIAVCKSALLVFQKPDRTYWVFV